MPPPAPPPLRHASGVTSRRPRGFGAGWVFCGLAPADGDLGQGPWLPLRRYYSRCGPGLGAPVAALRYLPRRVGPGSPRGAGVGAEPPSRRRSGAGVLAAAALLPSFLRARPAGGGPGQGPWPPPHCYPQLCEPVPPAAVRGRGPGRRFAVSAAAADPGRAPLSQPFATADPGAPARRGGRRGRASPAAVRGRGPGRRRAATLNFASPSRRRRSGAGALAAASPSLQLLRTRAERPGCNPLATADPGAPARRWVGADLPRRRRSGAGALAAAAPLPSKFASPSPPAAVRGRGPGRRLAVSTAVADPGRAPRLQPPRHSGPRGPRAALGWRGPTSPAAVWGRGPGRRRAAAL